MNVYFSYISELKTADWSDAISRENIRKEAQAPLYSQLSYSCIHYCREPLQQAAHMTICYQACLKVLGLKL